MASSLHLDFRTTNSLWASVLVATLARTGVARAVISPGSRSTPLALALAAHAAIEATPVLDERSAGFFALGLAKASGRPVLLLCTSGTAGANYFPAVIEAQESGVPLIVITADRPPELRGCASGQTIDQQKLFGDHVRFFHELAVPEASLARLQYLRQMVAHACLRTLTPGAGPVHLNAPFRDPLAPTAGEAVPATLRATDWEAFFAHLGGPPQSVNRGEVPSLTPHRQGVIVAGPAAPADPAAYADAVGEIARRLGWPVLSDGLSPLRHHAAQVPHLITTYDLILRNATAAERLHAEFVLCLGDWPTSKVLRGWVSASDPCVMLVSPRAENRDALHGRTRHYRVDPEALASALPAAANDQGYLRLWSAYEAKARAALDAKVNHLSGMFEGRATTLLAEHLPAGTPLCVANSMPVRDVEYFWPANDRRIQPFVNRGANGIDGTLSTALGVAAATGRPTVLLTGDLALLHDANGFLSRPKFSGSLTIVLINNRGGGIFEHLPVAGFEPPFEEFFATPQAVDFGRLCEAHGVEHTSVRDWSHFAGLVQTLPSAGIRVLELRTDRKQDAATRRQLFSEVAAGL